MAKIVYTCLACATVWAEEHAALWGSTRESQGMGPTPRCTNIVTDSRTNAGALCAGQLMAERVADDVKTRDPEVM